MKVIDSLLYAETHEWFDPKTQKVGISDFAQDQLGDVVYLDVSVSVGDSIQQGDSLGSIESVKTVSDLYAPVSGEISAINDSIDGNPELINSEPYQGGWLFQIKPSNETELKSLLSASDYQSQTE